MFPIGRGVLGVVAGIGLAAAVPSADQAAVPATQVAVPSPADAREAARFAAVVNAAGAAGYTTASVVGHGSGPADALFALVTSHEGRGVLTAVLEPSATVRLAFAGLETDEDPAHLGISGIDIRPFLSATDVFDVEVRHRPFRLEMSYEFTRHHLVRRRQATLTAVCEFDGGSRSSASKGMGSVSSTRTVAVLPLATSPSLTFGLTIVDETVDRPAARDAPPVTTRTETKKRYELPSAGACREVGGQR